MEWDVSTIARFLSSSVGRKILMAVAGLLLIGFLVMHMSANLLALVGAEPYNAYSHKLVSNPLIYVAELALLLLFVVHWVTGVLVWWHNRSARPHGYVATARAGHTSHKSLASTTMIWTGLVVLLFVPIHIAKFKFGPYYQFAGHQGVRDLHRLVVEVFQNPLWVASYVIVMVLVGFHLWHGFGSAFESGGISYRTSLRRAGQVLAVIIAGGFALVPVVIFLTGGKL